MNILREADYNKLNIRPNLDLKSTTDPNEDEIKFAQTGGWSPKNKLSDWSAKDVEDYIKKYAKDIEGTDSFLVLKNRVDNIKNPSKEKKSEPRASKSDSDVSFTGSDITDAIDNFIKGIKLKPEWSNADKDNNQAIALIREAREELLSDSKEDSAIRYLFWLCKPVIVARYHKYRGFSDQASKPPAEFVNETFIDFKKKRTYVKEKQKNLFSVTIEYLLSLNVDEVENLDTNFINTQQGIIEYFNPDKLIDQSHVLNSFRRFVSKALINTGVNLNDLKRTKTDDGFKYTKKLNTVSTLGSSDEDKEINAVDTAVGNQAKGGFVTNENDDFENWESLKGVLSVLSKKNPDKKYKSKILKCFQSIFDGKTYKESIINSGLSMDDVKLIFSDQEIDFNAAYQGYEKEKMEKMSESFGPFYKDLMSNLKKLREMGRRVARELYSEGRGIKTGEDFLKAFEERLLFSKDKIPGFWKPISFQSFRFETLRPVDILYLWLRNKSLGPEKRMFPEFVSTFKSTGKEATNDELQNDIDLKRISNYFVKIGWPVSSALRNTALVFYYGIYNVVIISNLIVEDFNALDAETAQLAMQKIKNVESGKIVNQSLPAPEPDFNFDLS